MSIDITITCDARTCRRSRDLDDAEESTIERAGWLIDYENDAHYCPKCKPMAMEELGLEDDDD